MLAFTVGDTVFPVGNFLQAVINFIFIAFVLFLVIKAMNQMKKKEEAAPAATPEDIHTAAGDQGCFKEIRGKG